MSLAALTYTLKKNRNKAKKLKSLSKKQRPFPGFPKEAPRHQGRKGIRRLLAGNGMLVTAEQWASRI
jgi:hypothetical protein